jgi:hypothetical protein
VPLKGAAHWKNLAPIQIRTLPDIAVALGAAAVSPGGVFRLLNAQWRLGLNWLDGVPVERCDHSPESKSDSLERFGQSGVPGVAAEGQNDYMGGKTALANESATGLLHRFR